MSYCDHDTMAKAWMRRGPFTSVGELAGQTATSWILKDMKLGHIADQKQDSHQHGLHSLGLFPGRLAITVMDASSRRFPSC
jgi:hypothetical protein